MKVLALASLSWWLVSSCALAPGSFRNLMHYLGHLHAKIHQDGCCLPLWPSLYHTAWEISEKGKATFSSAPPRAHPLLGLDSLTEAPVQLRTLVTALASLPVPGLMTVQTGGL